MQGTVKWFNILRGYGFITPEAGGDDIFVHQTQIYAREFRALVQGEEVEYEVELDESGRQVAKSVTGPGGDYVKWESNETATTKRQRVRDADDNGAKDDETH
jgi:cold shock CspA family protein